MLTDVLCSELLGIANSAIMLSGKCRISLQHLSNQKNPMNTKILRFSNIIANCDIIIQSIYQYIDHSDPDCLLPSHPAKLISEDVPSPRRIQVSLKRSKKNFLPLYPESEKLFDTITHSYFEIETEYREDI